MMWACHGNLTLLAQGLYVCGLPCRTCNTRVCWNLSPNPTTVLILMRGAPQKGIHTSRTPPMRVTVNRQPLQCFTLCSGCNSWGYLEPLLSAQITHKALKLKALNQKTQTLKSPKPHIAPSFLFPIFPCSQYNPNIPHVLPQ